MARPRYGNAQTEAAQNALRDRFCKTYNLDWFKNSDRQRINTTLFKKGSKVPAAFAEFRCRTNRHDAFETYMIDKVTWGQMKLRLKQTGTPTVLVIGFGNGVDMYFKVTEETAKLVTEGVGGRQDRGDEKDIEPVIHIPMSLFKKVGEKPKATAPEQKNLWEGASK